jgi:hypothetical protein
MRRRSRASTGVSDCQTTSLFHVDSSQIRRYSAPEWDALRHHLDWRHQLASDHRIVMQFVNGAQDHSAGQIPTWRRSRAIVERIILMYDTLFPPHAASLHWHRRAARRNPR